MSMPIIIVIAAFLTSVSPKAANQRKIRICSHNLPPHSYSSQKIGAALGLASELLHLITRELKVTPEIKFSTWERLKAESKSGNCDLAYTVLKKDEYKEIFIYPNESLPPRQAVFVVRRDKNIHFDGDLEKFMKKYSIGLYKDKVVTPLFDKLKKEPWAKVEEPVKSEVIFPMLMNNRFDAAIDDKLVAIHQLKQLNELEKAQVLMPPIYQTEAYIVFTKNGSALDLMEKFDQVFAQLKKKSIFKEILKKYGQTDQKL